jgi:hypothetical protein
MSLENGIAEQLAKVTTLHANGALSDSEFSAVKSKIIGFENPKQKISQLNGIDAAYQAALERALPSKLEPTWSDAIAVWWLIVWRTFVGALLLGGIVSFIISFIDEAFDESITRISTVVIIAIMGWIVGVAWHVAVVKMALQKKYSDFYLVLAPTDTGENRFGSQPRKSEEPPTPRAPQARQRVAEERLKAAAIAIAEREAEEQRDARVTSSESLKAEFPKESPDDLLKKRAQQLERKLREVEAKRR